jgi:surfactin synthase thioesterase subunit
MLGAAPGGLVGGDVQIRYLREGDRLDIPAEWRKRLANMTETSLPGGHFFVDQFPRETAEILLDFLAREQT